MAEVMMSAEDILRITTAVGEAERRIRELEERAEALDARIESWED